MGAKYRLIDAVLPANVKVPFKESQKGKKKPQNKQDSISIEIICQSFVFVLFMETLMGLQRKLTVSHRLAVINYIKRIAGRTFTAKRKSLICD